MKGFPRSPESCCALLRAGFSVRDMCFKKSSRDLPGGAVVRNSPANAGDTGSSPGPGRSHMPRSN